MEKLFSCAARGLLILAVAAGLGGSLFAQTNKKKDATPKPSPTPESKVTQKPSTAEEIAETTIFFYAYPGGRFTLDQIRKTTQEHGRTTVTNADGHVDKIKYQRYVIRAESLHKEKIRLDEELPNARFSIVYSDEKIFGIYNDSVFPLREDVKKGFENSIFHGLEALLRYKEDDSTLEMQPREKILGVDYYVIDVTDKQGRKTRFYVSAKSFRVMMLTYEDDGVNYRRKFYDYTYAQGTLVPNRSVLWADDKKVEESEVLNITFGQKVDEDLFKVGPTAGQ